MEELTEQSNDKLTLSTDTVHTDRLVTIATYGSGQMAASNVCPEVQNGDAPVPSNVKSKEEEDDTLPETSPSLTPENGTITIVTTEEESVSALLEHIRAKGGPDGDAGTNGKLYQPACSKESN